MIFKADPKKDPGGALKSQFTDWTALGGLGNSRRHCWADHNSCQSTEGEVHSLTLLESMRALRPCDY